MTLRLRYKTSAHPAAITLSVSRVSVQSRAAHDRLAYWRSTLKRGQVLHVLSTPAKASDGHILAPAGLCNPDYRGAVLYEHGRSTIGASEIGRCIDCWAQDGILYAVTAINPHFRHLIRTGQAQWSVGWLPVGSPATSPPEEVPHWRMLEYSLVAAPADQHTTTILARKKTT